MDSLENKHVVVTGGTGGLGATVVATLLARGAIVHAPMIEPDVPEQLAWKDAPNADARTGVFLDDESSVVDYYESLPPIWASIHLVGGFAMSTLVDTKLETFVHMHTLNVVPTFLCAREAARSMRKGGVGGRIVNVAAKPVLTPTPGMVAYAASKAAVASMTTTLAAELAAEGIFVNAIVPSIIDTAFNRKSMPDANHASWPKPAEIAASIAFLASPDNALTTGTLVPVYGKAG